MDSQHWDKKITKQEATANNLTHAPFFGMSVPRSSSSAHPWWKWETKTGRRRGSCGLLQVIALRKQRWRGKRRGGRKHKRTSQPLKVPASEVEMGLSKAWPLLAAIPDRNHSTILMTRCLVSLVWRMQVEGFFLLLLCSGRRERRLWRTCTCRFRPHTPLLTVALLFHSVA